MEATRSKLREMRLITWGACSHVTVTSHNPQSGISESPPTSSPDGTKLPSSHTPAWSGFAWIQDHNCTNSSGNGFEFGASAGHVCLCEVGRRLELQFELSIILKNHRQSNRCACGNEWKCRHTKRRDENKEEAHSMKQDKLTEAPHIFHSLDTCLLPENSSWVTVNVLLSFVLDWHPRLTKSPARAGCKWLQIQQLGLHSSPSLLVYMCSQQNLWR